MFLQSGGLFSPIGLADLTVGESNHFAQLRDLSGGMLMSTVPFTVVAPVNLESGDLLDTSDPSIVNFRLQMTDGWQDGFDFGIAGGAGVCIDVRLPGGAALQTGAERAPFQPPVNLIDFGPCR